jgi:glutamyl-tRNA synthetase
LRIEDTDAERSTDESVQEILNGLRWMGLDWDEGPYFQSHYVEEHVAAAERLLSSGHAYRCFCTKEELENQRKEAESKKVAFMYDGRCRGLAREDVNKRLAAEEPFVVRFAVPRAVGATVAFEDVVYGHIERKSMDIEDFVILRSDGRPLYILSNAVDDARDNISHVIRGADGLANTPKQVLLYEALGIEPPVFAHMPLTLDNKRAKLSKRTHGEVVTVAYYRKHGFLPWALCNFLALLGWSSHDGTEFFSREELIKSFDLSRINRSNSIFNYIPGDAKNWTDPKAIHFNATYVRTMNLEDLTPFVKQELSEHGLWRENYEDAERAWFLKTIDLIRARFHTITDFSSKGRPYFSDEYEFDEKAVKKNLVKDDSVKTLLPKLADALDLLSDFHHEAIEGVFRTLAEREDIPAGVLINAARTAVSGSSVGPSLFEMLEVIGRRRVVDRLRLAAKMILEWA